MIAKTVNARGYSSQIAYFIFWSPESTGRLGQASVTYFISSKGSRVSAGAVEWAVISYVRLFTQKSSYQERKICHYKIILLALKYYFSYKINSFSLRSTSTLPFYDFDAWE